MAPLPPTAHQRLLCCTMLPHVAAGPSEEWDPAAGLAPEQLADIERDYEEQLQRRRTSSDPPRDKWITPLLDWQVSSRKHRDKCVLAAAAAAPVSAMPTHPAACCVHTPSQQLAPYVCTSSLPAELLAPEHSGLCQPALSLLSLLHLTLSLHLSLCSLSMVPLTQTSPAQRMPWLTRP